MRCHSRHESTSPGAKCDKKYDKIGSNMIKGVWFCLILSTWFNLTSIQRLYHQILFHFFTHKSLLIPISAPEPFQAVLEWPHETHSSQCFPHKFHSETHDFFCVLQIQIYFETRTTHLFFWQIFPQRRFCWYQVVVEIQGVAACWPQSSLRCRLRHQLRPNRHFLSISGNGVVLSGVFNRFFTSQKDLSSSNKKRYIFLLKEKMFHKSSEWKATFLFLLTIEVFFIVTGPAGTSRVSFVRFRVCLAAFDFHCFGPWQWHWQLNSLRAVNTSIRGLVHNSPCPFTEESNLGQPVEPSRTIPTWIPNVQ